jgi:hypothetical protein
MISLYRRLLYLYPLNFRAEFGDEMADVFAEGRSNAKGVTARAQFFVRELAGLLKGAVQERWRAAPSFESINPLPPRRFTMRSGFRFPKSTAALMAVILAGVLLTMEKARSIVRSTSGGAPNYPDLFAEVIAIFAAACVLAAVVWVALYAARRSGVHRLSQTPTGESRTHAVRD